jgi:pre-mRNA-splicing factor CDC5/CEF1
MKAKEKWGAVEATYKQADILGTELECFRALHRQEQLSIPRRIEVRLPSSAGRKAQSDLC